MVGYPYMRQGRPYDITIARQGARREPNDPACVISSRQLDRQQAQLLDRYEHGSTETRQTIRLELFALKRNIGYDRHQARRIKASCLASTAATGLCFIIPNPLSLIAIPGLIMSGAISLGICYQPNDPPIGHTIVRGMDANKVRPKLCHLLNQLSEKSGLTSYKDCPEYGLFKGKNAYEQIPRVRALIKEKRSKREIALNHAFITYSKKEGLTGSLELALSKLIDSYLL